MPDATPSDIDNNSSGLPKDVNFTLYEILRAADKDLANYYLGALWSLANDSNPERYFQAAHSLRELIEKLPYKHKAATSIKKPPSITSQESNLYATLEAWKEVELEKTDGTDWQMIDIAKGTAYLKASERLWEFIGTTYPPRKEARLKMLSGLRRSAPLPPKLQNQQLNQWGIYYGKFADISHHGKNPTSTDFRVLVTSFEDFLVRELDPRVSKDIARIQYIVKEVEGGTQANLPELLVLVSSNRPNYDHFFARISSVVWLDILKKQKLDRLIDEPKLADGGRILTPSWTPGEYYEKIADQEPERVAEILGSTLTTKNAFVHEKIVQIAKRLPVSQLGPINKAMHNWLRSEFLTNTLLPFTIGEYIVNLAERGAGDEALTVFADLFELQEPKQKPKYFAKPETLTSDSSYRTILETCVPALMRVRPIQVLSVLSGELAKGLKISEKDSSEKNGFIEDYSDIWRPNIELDDHDSDPNRALISVIIHAAQSFAKTVDQKREVASLLAAHKYKTHMRIAANLLKTSRNADLKRQYQEVIGLIGQIDRPDFIVQETSVVSAIGLEDMKKLDTRELVDVLNGWDPKEDLPGFGRSRDDIGRTLAQYIQEDPGLIERLKVHFNELRIDYVWHIFSGVRILSDNKTSTVNWGTVIDLGKKLLSNTDTVKSEGLERQAQFDLLNALQSGLNQDHVVISGQSIAEDVLSIFVPLTSHLEPTVEYEQENITKDSGWNPVALAINTMRGEAVEGLIDLLRNVSRHTNNHLDRALSAEQISRIFGVLDDHLDTSKEETLSVRSVYARNFPLLAYVNRDWTETSIDKIFPAKLASQKYFTSAVETFLSYSRMYPEFFTLVQDQIGRYMELLEADSLAEKGSDVTNHLVGKILMMYIDDYVGLDHPLFTRLFRLPAPYLEEALDFLGRGCKDTEGERQAVIQSKAIEYWEHRLKQGSVYREEYEQMGMWLAWSQIDEAWISKQFLDALEHTDSMDGLYFVSDRLVELAKTDIDLTLLYFDRIAGTQSTDTIRHMIVDPELKRLLADTLKTHKAKTERVIDKLVERGYYNFADLLDH